MKLLAKSFTKNGNLVASLQKEAKGKEQLLQALINLDLGIGFASRYFRI